MNGRRPVIFCDFDGTITINDNIIAIMKKFNPPGWEAIASGVMDRSVTIEEGIGSMFALLPSSQREEIVSFALDNMKIRPGFPELLEFCRQEQIELLVTSGGIDFFVYPTLEPFGIAKDAIFCNASDFSGEKIRILWPHPCDDQCDGGCGMCKTSIIRSYPQDKYFRILIGDSVTDFAGALLADAVFARSHLLERYQSLGLPHYPYETFYEVIDQLKIWNQGQGGQE